MGLLEMSFSGAVFIVAVVIIRAMAINTLPKRTFLVLWDIVLFRLIFPFSVPSGFSIYTLMHRSISTPVFFETDNLTSAASRESVVLVQSRELPTSAIPSVSAWFIVWCAGMILFSVFFAVSYLRCRIEFQTALPVCNPSVEQWLKDHSLKHQISIRQSDRISAPLTYGIFHPVILMPKHTDWKNENQLQYIFSHQYVHIRHFDAITKLIATYALCIHWFNPFVWAMYILFNRDTELACDECVVRQFGEKSKSDYSFMLISMEAKKSGLYSLFATSAMTSADLKKNPATASNDPKTGADNLAAKGSMTVIHESADILRYEDGAPYIHDILTNNTAKTITETQYCMLAFDENGFPLKLHWNFLDSSAESSFENIVRTETNILSAQTEDYRGRWSLYDGKGMAYFSNAENGQANQVVYSLLCLKQIVFEDGTVWNNPDYENWFQTYAGKETDIDELQHYYPHEYRIALE